MTNQGKVAVLVLLGTGVVLLTTKAGKDMAADITNLLNKAGLPVGLRNNNPLNLRKTSIKWADEIVNTGGTGRSNEFESFRTLAAGLRAGIKNAKGKFAKGTKTIHSLINIWAPKSDGNDTAAYVAAVAKRAGVASTASIQWSNTPLIARIIQAMAIHECGAVAEKYLPLDFVQEQVRLVG